MDSICLYCSTVDKLCSRQIFCETKDYIIVQRAADMNPELVALRHGWYPTGEELVSAYEAVKKVAVELFGPDYCLTTKLNGHFVIRAVKLNEEELSTKA